MKNAIPFLLALLCLILGWSTYQTRQRLAELEAQPPVVAKPDTVYIAKPYKVKVVEYRDRAVPAQVKVYPTDTLLRDTLEQQPLITEVQVKRRQLTIARIDPKGEVTSDHYPLPKHLHSLTIDHAGHVAIRTKKPRRALKALGIVAGVGIVTLIVLR
jgi:hypothetical protein